MMAREFKDSGIEWIGRIPKEWNMQRLKSLCTIQTGNQDTQDAEPDGIYPFYVRSPLIERSNKYSFEGEGILMAGDGVGAGRVFHLATGKYAVHQRVYRLANIKSININYLYYFVSNLFCREMDRGSAQSTVPSVRLPMLQNFNICIPPKDYQQRIADYLDKKCGEIDELIALQEQMIAQLTDYKQSVITEAVTKGLNLDAEFVPSGIDWIGNMPKGWKIMKVKYIVDSLSKGNGITKEEVFADGDTPCVRYGEIYSKYNHSFNNCVSATNIAIQKSPHYFNYGDILCAGTGELVEEIGKSVVYLGEKSCLAGGDIIVISHHDNPSFLNYALNSNYAQTQKSRGKAKLKVVHISAFEIGSIYLLLPPLSEQQSIATYLDSKCSEIDSLIAIKQQKIETLKDYKKSVIYEAVTGKMTIEGARADLQSGRCEYKDF